MLPPSSTARVKRVRTIEDEPQEDNAIGQDAEASDSDSLVRFDANNAKKTRAKSPPRVSLPASNQVNRIAAGHSLARDAANAAETSESAEEAANIARQSMFTGISSAGAPALQQSSVMALSVGLPVKQEPTYAVYGAAGQPLSIHGNIDLMNKNLQQNLAKEAASTGAIPFGQLGRTVAEQASCLVREVINRGAIEARVPRADDHFTNPIEDTFLRELTYEDALGGPQLNPDTERQMRTVMIPSPREHEEEMLRTPRPSELPCSAGDKCIGRRIECPGGGAILMAYYAKHEWAKYQDELRAGLATARLPDLSRRCLLCIRYDANRFVINLRNQNQAFRHRQTPTVVSSFYNLVDIEGEYRSQDCIVANGNVYEGLLLPIVKPSLFGFEQMIDKTSGCIYFRQTLPYPGMKEIDAKKASF